MDFDDLPKFDGKAVIGALRIDRVNPDLDGATLVPRNVTYKEFVRDMQWVQEHRAHHGGYFIILESGTETFLPAVVFEALFDKQPPPPLPPMTA